MTRNLTQDETSGFLVVAPGMEPMTLILYRIRSALLSSLTHFNFYFKCKIQWHLNIKWILQVKLKTYLVLFLILATIIKNTEWHILKLVKKKKNLLVIDQITVPTLSTKKQHPKNKEKKGNWLVVNGAIRCFYQKSGPIARE